MPPDDRPGMIPQGSLNWKWALVMGIVLALGGIASLANPFAASLAVTVFAGVAFFLGGALQVWLAVVAQHGSSDGRLVAGGLGTLMIVLALALWFDPLAGMLTLTLLVAVLFLALGAVRIWLATRMRHRARWIWMAVSGALSILLAIIVFAALPEAAVTTLGLLLGIELVMSGVATAALALAARSG